MPDSGRTVRSEVIEGIALVTFAMPPRNAASAADWDLLAAALERHAADPAVRVLVLTGAGHHAFLTEPVADPAAEAGVFEAAASRAHAALAGCAKPVIARVRGECIGAGLLLALHADMVIAGEDSAFALPAAQWGGAYPAASVAALVRSVGPQQAKRLLFTGVRINGRDALQIGLVAQIVPDGELSDTVADLARDIADGAPLAVAAFKHMVDAPDDPALDGMAEHVAGSADRAAGIAAMRSGRRPAYHGR